MLKNIMRGVRRIITKTNLVFVLCTIFILYQVLSQSFGTTRASFFSRMTNFRNATSASLVNKEIDRMSETLMRKIEASVRGELPFLKRKLRHHQKPARLIEEVQSNLSFLFQAIARHHLAIEAETLQRDRQAFRVFGNYIADESRDEIIARNVRLSYSKVFSGYPYHCIEDIKLDDCGSLEKFPFAMSLIDSLPALLIQGLDHRFERHVSYLLSNFRFAHHFNALRAMPLVEVSGRTLGALLSAYYMTADPALLPLALEVGTHVFTVLTTRLNYLSLEDVAGVQLELRYLSRVLKNESYAAAAKAAWNAKWTGAFSGESFESFYGSVVKLWLYTNSSFEAPQLFPPLKFSFSLEQRLDWNRSLYFNESSQGYLVESIPEGEMRIVREYKGCGLSGSLILQSQPPAVARQKSLQLQQAASGLAVTCGRVVGATGLPCLSSSVEVGQMTKDSIASCGRWALRTESLESWLYLFRLTGERSYLDSAEHYFKTMQTNGFDLWMDRSPTSARKNLQSAHLVAAAHQFLYLTFSAPRFVSLADHVFNPYGHVFPTMAKLNGG